MMRISELIKILKKYKGDYVVVTSGYRGCVDWLYELKEEDIELTNDLYKGTHDKEIPKGTSAEEVLNLCKKRTCLVIG